MRRLLTALCLLAGLSVPWEKAAAGGLAFSPRLEKVAAVNALYPEGPAVALGRLLVAEMTADRVAVFDGKATATFWKEEGCGPTSVSPFGDGILVTCHLGGYLALVTAEGSTAERLYATESGVAVDSPNDSAADGHGGVYVSNSGVFSPSAPARGMVLYLGPDRHLAQVAGGIRYANGVTLIDAGSRLLVSEHLGGRILAFAVEAPGRLGPRAVLVEQEALIESIGPLEPLTGPDGIEPLDDGTFMVAIYGAGSLLRIGRDGLIRERFRVGPRFVTSLSRWQGEIVVTGAFDNRHPPYEGSIEVYRLRP